MGAKASDPRLYDVWIASVCSVRHPIVTFFELKKNLVKPPWKHNPGCAHAVVRFIILFNIFLDIKELLKFQIYFVFK